ncbi:GntR family transcriptional regulator [Caenimonas aquaedulcis]|uniref:GntR family transcriptional regulator n=1 Tax=Caenimonas aquaedulcis TaxID=2793270 RepID=A0A931MFJ1_9BURK|nr:GntR family transcriptional regulator [Caenimonas aquaedulcis]MBG9387376.1 GntR family transcriptional regulator [Caenimonas aquaedulcis]
MPQPIRLDRYRQASPQVYESLREMILSLELAPGSTLVRTELAARFGVSQTPVRDALQRLQHESLVDIFPQAATQVSKIDLALASQAHFLRRSLEMEIVRTLAQERDAVVIAKLRAWIAQQVAFAAARDLEGFSRADQSFHFEMYAACGQEPLHQLVRSLSGHIDRLRNLHVPTRGKVQRIVADHTAIVDAIAAGSVKRAQDALREHLSGTLAQAQAIRKAHPGYFSD